MNSGARTWRRLSDCGTPASRGLEGGFSLVELLVVLAVILILFVALWGNGSQSNQRKQLAVCESHLQNIFVALQTYSIAHTDAFPVVLEAKTSEAPLSELVPLCTTDTSPFTCPGCNDTPLDQARPFARAKISYAYYMGRKSTDGPGLPLLSDRQVNCDPKQPGQPLFSKDGKPPANNHNKFGGNVLFCDGSVQSSPAAAAFELTNGPGVVLLNPKP